MNNRDIDLMKIVVEQSFGGFLVIDPQGIVVYINKAYREFLGKCEEDIIGKHVTKVLFNTRLHKVAETGKAEYGVWQKQEDKYLCGHRIPLFNNGVLVGVMAQLIFQNPSEIASLTKELEHVQSKLEYYKEELKNIWSSKHTLDTIIGNSKAIIELKKLILKIASKDATILILGETGVGKEVIAHAIHSTSNRANQPFIKVNCAAIPHDLLESELFGYEEGAFTGARKKGKPGKFELAHGGTIFLDEIGDMPLNMQTKLLRVIQEKEIERVGGVESIKIDARIITATNQNLEELVKQGKFRSDLYYRLNVIPIYIPPLRERKEDIPDLIKYALKSTVINFNEIPHINQQAMDVLIDYDWPGNVRELFNVVVRLVNMYEGDEITVLDLPAYIRGKKRNVNKEGKLPLSEVVEQAERETINMALQLTNGNKQAAASLLGIHRITLYEKLKKYSIK